MPHLRTIICCLTVALLFATANLASAGGDKLGPDPKEVKEVLDKAIAYLKTKQNADGSFPPKRFGPGVSGLVVAGLVRNGVSPKEPILAKTLEYMEKQVQKDGGVYDKGLANYTTSVAIVAFHDANTGGKYDTLIKNASQFIKTLQQEDAKSLGLGGFGYDAKSRADLSNTNYAVEAMLAAGIPKDDPAVQNALKFISKCQNLPGETNNLPFAKKATKDDLGGSIYTPFDADDPKHQTPDGGMRSLGGMTYGGLKSFLYAGVSKDDPRVKASVDWIRRHYTLEENVGMGQAGLFYYYHTFGKAMQALGEDRFEDSKKVKHDWRRELFEALKKRQQPDGSWRNEGDKTFGEASPELATSVAVLTLSYCLPGKK